MLGCLESKQPIPQLAGLALQCVHFRHVEVRLVVVPRHADDHGEEASEEVAKEPRLEHVGPGVDLLGRWG